VQAGSSHIPVMPEQVLTGLQVQSGRRYCDATVGLGGHASKILERSAPDGQLVGLDRDPAAVERSARRLAPFGDRVTLHHGNFADLTSILTRLQMVPVDGLLLDLGVSSLQLDSARRGFSITADGPLDMRMDPTSGPTAAELIDSLSEDDLASVIRDYGEESSRISRRIARAIKRAHHDGELASTVALTRAISSAVGGRGPRRSSRIHPATRAFQALRIVVNDELGSLKRFLDTFTDVVRPGGRVAVIAFHSLEDRAVKQGFARMENPCTCPPGLPECLCGQRARLAVVTRRPIRPSEEEVARNPRSRSGRLRVAERL
jgi:16S rRNA (cytosine1402-N4)-methyltransferase